MQNSLPFTIFGGLALACGILVFCLPETSGKPLPDKLSGGVTGEVALLDIYIKVENKLEETQENLLSVNNAGH